MDELNADDLIKAWKFQDEFSDIAINLLTAGIELGVRSAGVEIAKAYIANNHEFMETSDFKKAMDKAAERSIAEIKKRVDNARGA